MLFSAYDAFRLVQVYKSDDYRPIHVKTVSEQKLGTIKTQVHNRINILRRQEVGEDGEDAEDRQRAIEKQKKFCNFIMNLHVRAGLRRWKDQVFGLGGDPRLSLLWQRHITQVKQSKQAPTRLLRKKLKLQKAQLRENNRLVARSVRMRTQELLSSFN